MSDVAALSYLHERNGRFYYRRRIPREIQQFFGKVNQKAPPTVIKIALKTSDRAEAKSEVQRLAAEIESRFREAYRQLKPTAGLPPSVRAQAPGRTWVSPEEISFITRSMLASANEADEEIRALGLLPVDEAESPEEGTDPAQEENGGGYGRPRPSRAALAEAVRTGNTAVVHYALHDWFVAFGIDPDPNAPDQKRAAYAFAKEMLRAADMMRRRDDGEIVDTPPAPVAIPATLIPLETSKAPRKADDKVVSIRTIMGRWAKESKPAAKTLMEAEMTCRELEDALRLRHGGSLSVPATAIVKGDIVAYKDALLDRKKPLSAKTIKKRLAFVKAWLNYAAQNDILPGNVAATVVVAIPRSDEKDRLPFTRKDMQAIFASPIYQRGASRPRARGAGGEFAYWAWILLAATGARISELAQLRVADVKEEDGVYYLDITDTGEGQRVKTKGSRRKTPVHSAVLALGFLEYVASVKKAGHVRLFPAVKGDTKGTPAGNFSQWAGRYLRKTIKINDPDKVANHSFRHALKDLCRDAGIVKEVHDAITGHKEGDVGSTYGLGVSLRVLAENVERLPLQEVLKGVPEWSEQR